MTPTMFDGVDGVKIAADVGGDPRGPAVMLMHGGGQTRFSWGKAARELAAAGYHVISLDLRGHGASSWASDGNYAIDAFVGDLMAVAATLPAPPALVGASLGGAASLLAVGEADRAFASALVLVDVVPHMEKRGIDRIRNFMQANPAGFANLDEAAAAVAAYMPNRPRPASHEGLMKNLRSGPDGRLYWHWDPAFQSSRRMVDSTGLYERMDRAGPRVRIPTLLVRGKASEVVSTAGAAHLLKLIPHAETVDVEGAGHMVAGDKNDAFNSAVRAFLDRHVGAGPTPHPCPNVEATP
jgi:pimeloyl-ACP methyl ester carboxylesterase